MMGKSGIPLTAEERVSIAIDQLIPRAIEVGIPMENLYLDPLVLTVSGCQEYCPPAIEAVRYIKQGMDPAPMTTVRAEQRFQPGACRDAQPFQPRLPGDAHGRGPRFRHRRSAGQGTA